jgi:hypothetical protein
MVIEKLKKLAFLERIAFKKHGLIRLQQRNLVVDDIKMALTKGELVETYEGNNPLPAFLILGYTNKDRPIHIVVALDEAQEMLWIITAYEPDLEEWEPSFRVRRKQ